MIKTLAILFYLIRANISQHAADLKKFIAMSSAMFIQNAMFFALWVVLFDTASSLKGWMLVDVARMFGLISISFGLYYLLFAGIRSLPLMIQDGSFESFLVRPKHPLLPIMCSSTGTTAIGDVLFGVVIWAIYGDLTFADIPMLLLVCAFSLTILMCSVTMVFSMALWFKGNIRFSDQLYEMLLIFACNVIHGQPLLVKIIAFTILPAGFINYLPVTMMDSFSWTTFGILIAAVIFYVIAALAVFNGGVRRYKRMS